MIGWKDIPGYEGIYQVSNTGCVKRLKGSQKCSFERILKACHDTNGYLHVCLCRNGKAKQIDIHRLVAWAFLGTQGSLWVNHKNGIKSDNHIENIEYVTPGENTRHAYNIGLQPSRKGEGNGRSELTVDDIKLIRQLSDQGISRKEICHIIGRSKTTIQGIITGNSWESVQ